MKINVCLASDNNYFKYLVVTIASILKNANVDDELYFYILEKDISIENKNKILELEKIKKFKISFVQVDYSIFEKSSIYKTLPYISKVTYFRFLIADLLKNLDKVLYLDCDVIVCNSLSKLYKENIDDYYCAGVEDIGYYFFIKNKIYYITDIYVNAGVLLLNLNLWRQNNLSLKCMQVVENGNFIFADQDVINKVCENKIKIIDISWNFQQVCFDIINRLKFHPLKKEIKNAIKNYNIIHYTGSKKPWNSYTPLIDKYYDTLYLVPKNNINISKFKIFYSFCKYWGKNIAYILLYICSPIFYIYRDKEYINVEILKIYKFAICKTKNNYFQE